MNQYGRKCDLIISNNAGNSLDVSKLRITFVIKKGDNQTPNEAEFKIYNLSDETVNQIRKEFTKVILQAGYEENYGVIFDGSVRQIKTGRDNGTDTFLHIFASDGDEHYNFAIVNTTLGAGASQSDQMNAAAGDTPKGYIADTGGTKLPRGKVMYGMMKDYMRQSAESTDSSWSIQDGKLQVVPLKGLLPSQAVVLNSKSGLVDTPTQENDGIKARCLLNPMLKIGGKVIINQEDIASATIQTINKKDKNAQIDKPASFSSDGTYKLIQVEYVGDTRGNDWYCDLLCLDLDATVKADKSVKDK